MNRSGSDIQILQMYSYGVRPFSILSVLVIAGLDSSTGAGLARGLAELADHGVAAQLVATAVTAQDAGGGCCVHPISAAVAETLPDLRFVLDPVLATSAGAVLLDAAGRAAMIIQLIPRAALVTSNLPEAAILTALMM